jgi:hypothetical protein
MNIGEKYKAEHVIIPLIRSVGVNLEAVKAEITYRKSNPDSRSHPELKFITTDELIGAETMWNKV